MDVPVLFEDDVLLVINKPSGLVVNRAESVKTETVQDWIEMNSEFRIPRPRQAKRGGQNSELKDTDFYRRSGIVHRIDKETSGCLIIAKDESIFFELQNQFKERRIKKTYCALLHGELSPKRGIIKAPVGRLPWNRQRFGVFPGGREAETSYEVTTFYEKNREKYSLTTFFPKSGRTHQIRVHAKYISHPIVSDSFYVGKKTVKTDKLWCPRLFLHAQSIGFYHPVHKKDILVEAPLALDLKSALKELKKSYI